MDPTLLLQSSEVTEIKPTQELKPEEAPRSFKVKEEGLVQANGSRRGVTTGTRGGDGGG